MSDEKEPIENEKKEIPMIGSIRLDVSQEAFEKTEVLFVADVKFIREDKVLKLMQAWGEKILADRISEETRASGGQEADAPSSPIEP